MTKKFQSLNDTFNIESEVLSAEIEPVKEEHLTKNPDNTELDKDFELLRGVLHSTLSKSQEALDSILELAQETNSPRAYEVVGMIVKSINDTSNQMMENYKKKKDIKNEANGPTNVTNNAMLFCTTTELSKLLKEQLRPTPEAK